MSVVFATTLKKAFDPYFPAPIDAWLDFASLCREESFNRDETIKEANSTARDFHFILEGSVGVFIWKDNGEVCLDFAFENNFIGDYMSVLTGEMSPLLIRAIEPSRVLSINRLDYLNLGKTEIGMVLMRAAAESSYITKQRQQIDLLTKTAELRYIEMLQVNPQWVLRVPQKYLASYLGITPQSLSRIRKTVHQQKTRP